MFPHLEDGGSFSLEDDCGLKMSTTDVNTFGDGYFPFRESCESTSALFENPGIANGSTPNEDTVNSVTILVINGLCCCGDVSVAENGDVDVRVALHGTNH